MRKSLMTMILVSSVALAACSDKPEEDDLFLGERADITTTAPMETGNMGVGNYDGYTQERMGQAVPGSMEDLIVNVGDRVYFGYDRHDLTPEAMTQLQMQARWLGQYPNVRILIEGHADERGTREYNLALGDRRANAARDYLVSLGVAPSRVSTISFGKEMPEVLGSDSRSWAQNRRSVTKVQ